MIVIGVDLSGPTNHRDTVMVWGRGSKSGTLRYVDKLISPSDELILSTIGSLEGTEPIVIGLDAPLSYHDGGGFRDSDRSLQRTIIQLGMRPGSVMVPTLTRMCYLTLRGIGLSRAITHLPNAPRCRIVETHPGAVYGLHGAPLDAVLSYRDSPESRRRLLSWLAGQKVEGLPESLTDTSHATAACGALFGAWHWASQTSRWSHPRSLPQHPFDFAC